MERRARPLGRRIAVHPLNAHRRGTLGEAIDARTHPHAASKGPLRNAKLYPEFAYLVNAAFLAAQGALSAAVDRRRFPSCGFAMRSRVLALLAGALDFRHPAIVK